MIIEIDINRLIKYKINAHQYVIAKLMLDNQKILEKYKTASPITKDDIAALVSAEIVKQPTLFEPDLKLTTVFEKEFDDSDWFDEILALYPEYITRPDGTKDWLKVDLTRTRSSYLKHVKRNRHFHESILDALQKEVKDKTQNNKMGYMKRINSWVASENWLAYMNRLDFDSNNEKSYGTDLV